jgi:hypothetical protein
MGEGGLDLASRQDSEASAFCCTGEARNVSDVRQQSTLFDVLHLFAHLLDDHFHLNRRARGFQILRF